MATAAEAASEGRSWHEIVQATLKANEVRLVTYVPDNVLKPLIAGAARIDDPPGVGATDRDPVVITDRFMRGLGTKK